MKLDKLLKRLKRDLSASPQKAAALGLMILVALYFWAPLIIKFVGGGQAKKSIASQVNLTAVPAITPVAVQPASDPVRWDRVRAALAQDRFMLAAAHQTSWQNPFRRHPADTNTDDSQPAAETELKQPGEPAVASDDTRMKELAAGIVVTSVLISARDRAAFIRGTTYRVGDVLEIGGENGERKLELLLTSIDEDGVDVNLAGRTLRLERTRARLTPGSQLKSH